jgi:hypothetical protein
VIGPPFIRISEGEFVVFTWREPAFGSVGIALGALAFGCAGIAIGAAIVGATWGAQSWQSQTIPPGYSRLYDVCLADGKSRTACGAVIRLAVEQAKAAQTTKDYGCFEVAKGRPC